MPEDSPPQATGAGNLSQPDKLPTPSPLPLVDPEPELEIANAGPAPAAPFKLPTFRPRIIGNLPTAEIANAPAPAPQITNVGKKGRKHGPAVTVEPRVLENGIGLLIRAAYWVDKDRKSVLYIQSTDLERLRQYEQQIKKWAASPRRRKQIPGNAIKNLGLDPDSP